MDKQPFYITTPIYYPSSNLHIGHTYCTVMADAMARYKRLTGYDVMFLTGTDEHGQKIKKVADENGVTPKEYVDKIVDGIKELWKVMEISNDDFIRTTDDRHTKRVQSLFMKMYEKGDVYKGEYEGWYCTPCEAFWTETQAVGGKCPDCNREVSKAKEETYFFKLSKYQDKLIDLFENNKDFLQPESRRNEMLNFVKQGLDDLSISRSSFDWGIKVPLDERHVIYVWLDALTNYITALGYPGEDTSKFDKYWPCDVHLVGKEIVRFHSIIWPAMLMSLDIPLPKKVLGHGFVLFDGDKMSKSKGNVVDPVALINLYGVDSLKYFLLREFTVGNDGIFTNELLINRINSDLANDLGNLLSRTVSMIEKYNEGIIPLPTCSLEADNDLKDLSVSVADKVDFHMNNFEFNKALEEIWILVRRTNKYIDETTPWILAKDDKDKERLNTVLYNLAESLRITSILIYPYLHNTSKKIREQLGIVGDPVTWADAKVFGIIPQVKVIKGDPIFPRLDVEKEIEKLLVISGAGQEDNFEPLKPEITIDDFEKVDLRVGEIIDCKKHPKADKLLVSKVKIGGETRQIVSGVAAFYTPEEMIGKKIVVVANLKPIKLRGEESKGMILFADNGEKLEFVTTLAGDGELVK